MQILLSGLKQLRKTAGLSQQQLAEKSGLSVSTISKHEQGVLDGIDGGTLEALVEALGCAKHELFLPPNSDASEIVDFAVLGCAPAPA